MPTGPSGVPDPLHLRLAGVTRLALSARGPHDAYVFDPHRLALPCWALALEQARVTEPALLITLDRHFDFVVPQDVAAIPDQSDGVETIDAHARWKLDVRNHDHIAAAMEAGLVSDVIVIARARPAGALTSSEYFDRSGTRHRIVSAPNVDRLASGFGTASASDVSMAAEQLLHHHAPVLLDVDLDCFTTPSDADPTTIVPWPVDVIRDFLLPLDSEPFWNAVLARAVCLTIAREPYHCGGLIASGRLFESAAEVIFKELLRADLP